jgi:glucosylceramidase
MGQQAVKYGVNRFFADSWGAPGYMKTNNSYVSGGVICDGTSATQTAGSHCLTSGFSDCRAAYANYMVQYVKDYLADGVPISDMDWINEPNTNTGSYASMVPTSAEAITFLNAYGPIVRAALPNVNQVCCDVYDWATANTYDNTVAANATANSYVDIYSAHEYGQVANLVLATSPAKKNWMTEWGPQSPDGWNPYWDTVFAGTSNNYNDGMFIANDISNALNKGQISSYLYWYADSTSSTGAMLEPDGPYAVGKTYAWPASTLTVPARFYSLAHFSRFIRPGAYQVTMSTNSPACTTITSGVGSCIVPTAFVNSDGSKVINVVNNITTGSETLTLTLDAGSANWVPAAYVTDAATIPNTVANSSSPEALNTAVAVTPGVATVSGTTLTATFPARSFTTIVLTKPVVAGTVQLVASPTHFAEGDGTVLSTITITNSGTGTAQNVTLTSATLGTSAGTTMPTGPLPFSIGNIAPGGSKVVSVNYAAGQTPGATVVEKIAGTYTGSGGNGSFNASFRAVVPTLP